MDTQLITNNFQYIINSLTVAAITAFVTVLFSLLMIFVHRLFQLNFGIKALIAIANLGYSIPGSVLAIGLFIPLVALDHKIADAVLLATGKEVGLIITGSAVILILGLAVRFIAISYNTLSSHSHRIATHVDDVTAVYGYTGIARLTKVYIPLFSRPLRIGAILVFIEVLKEMPLTLMTRPFNWDTLSVKIYEFTSEGEWERAAFPAMLLVIIGLVPLIMFDPLETRNNKS